MALPTETCHTVFAFNRVTLIMTQNDDRKIKIASVMEHTNSYKVISCVVANVQSKIRVRFNI